MTEGVEHRRIAALEQALARLHVASVAHRAVASRHIALTTGETCTAYEAAEQLLKVAEEGAYRALGLADADPQRLAKPRKARCVCAVCVAEREEQDADQ